MENPLRITKSVVKNTDTDLQENRRTVKDETLVWRRFIEGDNESLVYIYKQYAEVLFRYGQQFSKKHEFVQDCIQELFYELIDKRTSLSEVRSIKAYLLVSIKRKILRSSKKEDKLQLGDDTFSFLFDTTTLSISTSLKEQDYLLIYDEINKLPTSQREVIFLYFYEGMGYAEIAEIMGVKTATARTLTYRALERLEEKLGPHIGLFLMLMFIK